MNIPKNIQRYSLELSVLIALILFLSVFGNSSDPETFCPFGGIQALVNFIAKGSLPCGMSSVQIFVGIALILAVVLFSKLFCAYICPLGTVSSLLMKMRVRWGIKALAVPENNILDKILRIIKYILLFLILYNTVITGELFCKHLDPYYAVATGFKGELVVWVSIGILLVFILGSFFVDNFWCRYLCPLGALSNTFKYWLWIVTLFGVVFIVRSIANQIPEDLICAIFCLSGYCFEIFSPKSSFQILNVQRDESRCSGCEICEKKCPYHIKLTSFNGPVESVDCTLCGECIEHCSSKALHVGGRKKGSPNLFNRLLPAGLTILLAASAIVIAENIELPTINEYWDLSNEDRTGSQQVELSSFKSFDMEGLNQIHCYASSITFSKKLRQLEGVHGVKTYARHHKATIYYDPDVTSPGKIQQELFVPKTFQIFTPDYKQIPELRVLTMRVGNMSKSNAINLLGLQFKQADSLIYGLETEWDIPVIVRMYVNPSFEKDEEWISSIVRKPKLELKNERTGKSAEFELNYDFIRMETMESTIKTTDFLDRMFKPFKAIISTHNEDDTMGEFLYEIPEKDASKPIIMRSLPILASYLSLHDGVGSVYTCLDAEYTPQIVISYYPPMTEESLENLLNSNEWTIRNKDCIRSISAPLKFKKGVTRKID